MNDIIDLKGKVFKILKGEHTLSKKQELIIGVGLFVFYCTIIFVVLNSSMTSMPILNYKPHHIINKEEHMNQKQRPFIEENKSQIKEEFILNQ